MTQAPVDPRGILARKWAEFAHMVLDPANAGPVQRTEMRRAWYAGVVTMFEILNNLAGPGDEPDEVGAARVEQVYQEIRRYAESLRQEI